MKPVIPSGWRVWVGSRNHRVEMQTEDMCQVGEQGQAFAAIVLAAGAAPRNGRPIALQNYLGRSLVEHAVRKALAAGANEVVVVANHDAEKIRRELAALPVRVIENSEWREGIASSIRLGVSRLRSDPAAAVICLCDQPRITPDHLRALATGVLAKQGPTIAASAYDGVCGAPAAFARSVFPSLLALSGNEGARRLIRDAAFTVETIVFTEANEELESPACSDPPPPPRTSGVLPRRGNHSRAARAPPAPARRLVAV